MKFFELKPLWILVVASFIMAFMLAALEGRSTNMDLSVYYTLVAGSGMGLVAMSSVPALVIAGVDKILSNRPLVHAFSLSVWFFWVIAIVVRVAPNF
jgi:hypothetical protein